jgi:hypothetical protein
MSGTSGAPSLEEFLEMDLDSIRVIVGNSPEGSTGVLVPDGNRKAGLILWGLDPSKKDFDRDLFTRLHAKFLEVVRMFFEHGVRVLYVPTVTTKNFDRGKAYMDAAMTDGLVHFFHDPLWLSFYEEQGVKVKFYGNRDVIREKGFETFLAWMDELERRTAKNENHLLLLGLACERSLEEVRLAGIGIELHSKLGRAPTRSELVEAYYGQDLPDVGFFIRPTEVRDSDMLPVLTSGYKTQMYFPVSPAAFLSKRAIRAIFHDLVYNRVASGGKKIYRKEDISPEEIRGVKNYYEANLETILGLGERRGPFWLPNSGIPNSVLLERVSDGGGKKGSS